MRFGHKEKPLARKFAFAVRTFGSDMNQDFAISGSKTGWDNVRTSMSQPKSGRRGGWDITSLPLGAEIMSEPNFFEGFFHE